MRTIQTIGLLAFVLVAEALIAAAIGWELTFASALRKVMATPPLTRAVILAENWSLFGGYEKAMKLFDELIAREPKKAEYYYFKARTEFERVEPESIDITTFLFSAKPSQEQTCNLAKQALQHFSKCISLQPDFAAAYYWRTRARSALLNCELSLLDEPSEEHINSKVSKSRSENLKDLKVLIALAPTSYFANKTIGEHYEETEDFERSLAAFEKAKQTKPQVNIPYDDDQFDLEDAISRVQRSLSERKK